MNESGILVIGSHNLIGVSDGAACIADGGTPVDAVERAIRPVEDNPDDHTVGYSGWPNLIGEVECDASIMDGTTLRTGAIGALKGYRYPITVARCVMERLAHVLLVGDGAARFAAEMNCEKRDMLSEEARETWTQRLRDKLGVGDPDVIRDASDLSRLGAWAVDPEHVGGTVTCITRGAAGRLAAGVSTSGFAWKYPGRLGDSPIVGAGCYADDRHGAAVCTGFGEWTISTSTARSVVLYMKMGMPVEEAAFEAVGDLHHVALQTTGVVNVVAIDAEGRHVGVTTHPPETTKTYVAATPGPDLPKTLCMKSLPPPPDSPAGRALT